MPDSTQPTLVLRGGTIVDGTGAPPFVADIAISGSVISAVGKDLALHGLREVDATGLIVTPGFVDPHTHYDAQMQWDPYFSPSVQTGVTTLIVGNCGVGIAPCQPEMRDTIMDVCDAVENLPSHVLKKVLKWDWETFPEYLEAVEKFPYACDVGILVGHAPVRAWVMGSRCQLADLPGGPEANPVSHEDIERMAKVVEEAVAAGAMGISISRVSIHRDTKGRLTPGSLASSEEMLALAKGVADGGGGVMEMASSWNLYDDVSPMDMKKVRRYQLNEWEWITKVATMDPDKLLFTFGFFSGMDKASSKDHFHTFNRMENIAKQGGKIMGTPMMRCGPLSFNLGNNVHPFVMSKTWRELKKKAADVESLAARMRENRAQILEETEAMVKANKSKGMHFYNVVFESPKFLFPWSEDPEPSYEKSFHWYLKNKGVSYLEQAFDVLTQPHAAHGGNLRKILFNYGGHDMEANCDMLKHEQVVPGFADGGAHMLMQCEGTTCTTMLTHFVRDRTRGPKLPIEFVVNKQTSATAKMLGLTDRGELRPGMKADINVIDLDNLRLLPPEYRNDMPEGMGRMYQQCRGYRMTLVSGEVVLENDTPTGVFPGKLVRNPKRLGLKDLKGSVPPGETLEVLGSMDMTERALELSKGGGASAMNRIINNSNL